MHPTGADQEPLVRERRTVQVRNLTLAVSIAMLNIPYPDPGRQRNSSTAVQ